MLVSPCYYTKPLLTYIDSVIEDGANHLSDINDYDMDQLTALCIDCLGADAYQSIIDSEDLQVLLKKYIISCNSEDAISLSRNLHETAKTYFMSDLENLFNERLAQHQSNKNYDNEFRSYKDWNSGETMWLQSA